MKITIDETHLMETSIYTVYEGEETTFRLKDSRKKSQVLTWFYGRTADENDDLVAGMGQRSNLTAEQIRRTSAAAARMLLKENKSSAVLIRTSAAPGASSISVADEFQAWVEGWIYGLYQFNKHRGVTANVQTVTLNFRQNDWQGLSREDMEIIMESAKKRIEGTQLTRDLVNESPETLNPEAFVAVVEERFKKAPVQLHVYRGQELVDRQMSGLLAVGAGSKYEPAMIELSYNGINSDHEGPHIVLIGKGVTFDMGGMNVKIGRDISDARMDMGGAAAVIGAMDILVSQKAKVRVTALIAVADNLSGPDAMLPSSVIHYPNGLSVQVANTDGEGRLIIADALLHAATLGADKVIDIATLTGNVGTALGLEIAGIWGDQQITSDLVEIGERNGERLWPMPLMDEYESELKSDYADLRNVGTSTLAGAITAALFIRHFVADSMKWVHIDMAGTVQYKREFPHSAAGATGYGARLLADYVEKQFHHA